ncbi:MAG: hypothetical protein ACFE96_13735, partial [Candidatus Hermodarchaeota archaeon]
MRIENDIIFVLNKEIRDRINKCIRDSYPNEACGFLFGDIQETNNHGDFKYTYYCSKIHCIESSVLSPASFLLDNDKKIVELSNTIIKNGG